MKRLLIIRFSAIGDVAMTIPVIYACAIDNPQLQITVLSREFLKPLFSRMPSNVQFRGVDLKKESYRGIKGLNKLYRELKKEKYDAIADFHDVLRSKYLRLRFSLEGTHTVHIRKGRKEKKALTRVKHKVMQPLKSSFQRYTEVLNKLNIHFTTHFTSIYPEGKGDLSKKITTVTGQKEGHTWIGIAPFAAHQGKTYNLQKMESVIKALSQSLQIRIFIFGAGTDQQKVGETWQEKYPHSVVSIIGKLAMDEELVLMSHLNVMLSMDSANIHLASLVNTPVVSIWGATHPYAGFMGWNQKTEDTIQLDLPCRPCSVYGNKPCWRKDYACLNRITPKQIVERLKRYLD